MQLYFFLLVLPNGLAERTEGTAEDSEAAEDTGKTFERIAGTVPWLMQCILQVGQ